MQQFTEDRPTLNYFYHQVQTQTPFRPRLLPYGGAERPAMSLVHVSEGLFVYMCLFVYLFVYVCLCVDFLKRAEILFYEILHNLIHWCWMDLSDGWTWKRILFSRRRTITWMKWEVRWIKTSPSSWAAWKSGGRNSWICSFISRFSWYNLILSRLLVDSLGDHLFCLFQEVLQRHERKRFGQEIQLWASGVNIFLKCSISQLCM